MTYASPAPLTFSADRLAGKVVFVTGASSGIGAAAVRRFAAEGALVAAAARRTCAGRSCASSTRSRT